MILRMGFGRRSMAGMLLVAVTAFAAACGAGDTDVDHNPGALYPDRANQYREDQERRIAEAAFIGGYTATVTDVRLDDEQTSMLVSVEITNRDDEPQRVDGTHWTLVNPRVQTIEAATASFPGTELAAGATTTGVVAFSVDRDGLIVDVRNKQKMATITSIEALRCEDHFCGSYLKAHRAGILE